MFNRIKIYSNLFKSLLINETKALKLYHVFTNATELINIKKRGYHFIHINKNGGSTVESVLKIKDQSHLPYYVLEDYFGVSEAKKLNIVSMVRNPYDRIVSQYHYRLQNNQYGLRDKNISFKDFCRLAYKEGDTTVINFPLMFKTQYEWLQDNKGCIDHIKYIGRFEDFNNSVLKCVEFLGVEKNVNEIPLRRSSKRRKDWTEYYDDETRSIIYNYFKKDFEAFNYKK